MPSPALESSQSSQESDPLKQEEALEQGRKQDLEIHRRGLPPYLCHLLVVPPGQLN